jgi:hypothetical protein
MQSLDDKIFNTLKECGRCTIFSSADFHALGEVKLVSKAIRMQILLKHISLDCVRLIILLHGLLRDENAE